MIKIKYNDFQEMRAEYTDALRMRNYNDTSINTYLNEFDEIVRKQRWDALTVLMKDIGVQLIGE